MSGSVLTIRGEDAGDSSQSTDQCEGNYTPHSRTHRGHDKFIAAVYCMRGGRCPRFYDEPVLRYDNELNPQHRRTRLHAHATDRSALGKGGGESLDGGAAAAGRRTKALY